MSHAMQGATMDAAGAKDKHAGMEETEDEATKEESQIEYT